MGALAWLFNWMAIQVFSVLGTIAWYAFGRPDGRRRAVAYQRERIRRWLKEEGGTLVHEEVFLELAPDRGSEQLVATVVQESDPVSSISRVDDRHQ